MSSNTDKLRISSPCTFDTSSTALDGVKVIGCDTTDLIDDNLDNFACSDDGREMMEDGEIESQSVIDSSSYDEEGNMGHQNTIQDYRIPKIKSYHLNGTGYDNIANLK